jgi:hypothetical protein
MRLDPNHDAIQLVWKWRAHELRDWPLIDDGSWVSAVQKDMITYYENKSILPNVAAACPPYYNACVIMMVKDECDVIDVNLRHLYRLGVRRFVISDNNSSDDTLSLIEEFRRYAWSAEVIIVQDHILRYTQSEKTTGLMLLASQFWRDCGWVFPIDADEFLIAEKGLSVLDEIEPDVNVIVIGKALHSLSVHNERQASHQRAWLEKMPTRNELGGAPPNVALRPRSDYVIAQGNHFVVAEDLLHIPGLSLGLHFREFPIRSFEQFRRKTINGGKAVHAANRYTKRAVGGTHWIRWYDSWLKGGDAELRKIFDESIVKNERINDPLDIPQERTGCEAIPPGKPKLPNVALNKSADQSSISEWSLGATTKQDAGGAVDGNITGQFSFHTALETDPWWEVDLEDTFLVSEIWIHNRVDRVDTKRRFQSFKIDALNEKGIWTRLYTGVDPVEVGGRDGYPFVLKLSPAVLARVVRITLLGYSFLHLDEVEVFGMPKNTVSAL